MLIALYYSAFVIALALIPLSIVNAVEAPYKNWKKNSIAFVSYATVLIASICSVYFCFHSGARTTLCNVYVPCTSRRKGVSP